jgi:hypothetical protein
MIAGQDPDLNKFDKSQLAQWLRHETILASYPPGVPIYDFVDDLAVDVNADSLAGIEKAVAENVTQMIVPRNSDCACLEIAETSTFRILTLYVLSSCVAVNI